MCQENGEGKREAGKDGGVERTHREARSHDLMNELAWLLASVVGCTRSPCSAVFPQPRREREREKRGRGGGGDERTGNEFRTAATWGEELWIDANRARIDVSIK